MTSNAGRGRLRAYQAPPPSKATDISAAAPHAAFSTHGSEAGAIGALNVETTRQGVIFTCINDFEPRMITTLLSLLLSPSPRVPRPADSPPPMTRCPIGRRSLPGRWR
jgi:hypothetical protein